MVVVNAAGLPTESDGGRLLGRKYINNISLLNDLLPQIADPLEEEIASWNSHVSKAMLGKSKESKSESLTHSNTVIGVVATNAKLTRAELQKLAAISHDGLARCIWPIHTPFDGDSLFSLSTGQLEIEENREIWPDIMLRPQILSKIYECGATSVARATLRAVLTADAKREVPAYRSFFPSLYTL